MSSKHKTKFAVKHMSIMENTLTKMGINFSKKNDNLIVKRSYHDIVISAKGIDFDSDNKNEIEKIKTSYSEATVKKDLELEGLMYEVIETENEIIIYA